MVQRSSPGHILAMFAVQEKPLQLVLDLSGGIGTWKSKTKHIRGIIFFALACEETNRLVDPQIIEKFIFLFFYSY